MKNVPSKIYLQVGEHPENCECFKDLEGVTWNSEQVHETDLVYYRKKILVEEDIPEFHESIKNMPQESKNKVDRMAQMAEIENNIKKFFRLVLAGIGPEKALELLNKEIATLSPPRKQ